MTAALSLLDEDPFDPAPHGALGPQDDRLHPHEDERPQHPGPLDPEVVRDRASMIKALKPGGISVPMLLLATLVASPALIQCLVHHSISFTVMLERWVVITLGCWAIGEGARRYVAQAQRRAAGAAGAAVGSAAETPVAMSGLDET